MRILHLLPLLALGVVHGEEASTELRLAAWHRTDGRLVRVLGPVGAARYEAVPATTHYLMYAQASHAPVWIAATANSLVYGEGGRQYKTALKGEPRAISISPDGGQAAVLVGTTITSFILRSFPMLSSRYSIEGLPNSTDVPVEITSTNGAGIWFSTPDASYTAGIDRRFSPVPRRFTLLRPLPNKRGTVAYDLAGKAVVLLRQDRVETLAASNAGIVLPSAMELTADGPLLWISQTGSEPLASIALDSGEVRTYPLAEAGTIRPTAENGVYIWSEHSLLDTRSGTPQLVPIAPARR